MQFVILERWCRVLGATVRAGVALPDALVVASESTNNTVYQERLAVARDSMIRGAGLAQPIAETKLFPAAARQMIRVGESTGTLDRQLDSSAEFYERELTYKLRRFTDLFEPAIIIVVGVVVGFVALALVQAMYGVFDQVQA
jgi:type IV pilus assembly protein PilC